MLLHGCQKHLQLLSFVTVRQMQSRKDLGRVTTARASSPVCSSLSSGRGSSCNHRWCCWRRARLCKCCCCCCRCSSRAISCKPSPNSSSCSQGQPRQLLLSLLLLLLLPLSLLFLLLLGPSSSKIQQHRTQALKQQAQVQRRRQLAKVPGVKPWVPDLVRPAVLPLAVTLGAQ
jgi:hypothetical protein